MAEQNNETPKIITIDNVKYSFDTLTDEIKSDLAGLRICESQLRLHQDSLKLLTISRQAITNQLKNKLKDISPID